MRRGAAAASAGRGSALPRRVGRRARREGGCAAGGRPAAPPARIWKAPRCGRGAPRQRGGSGGRRERRAAVQSQEGGRVGRAGAAPPARQRHGRAAPAGADGLGHVRGEGGCRTGRRRTCVPLRGGRGDRRPRRQQRRRRAPDATVRVDGRRSAAAFRRCAPPGRRPPLRAAYGPFALRRPHRRGAPPAPSPPAGRGGRIPVACRCRGGGWLERGGAVGLDPARPAPSAASTYAPRVAGRLAATTTAAGRRRSSTRRGVTAIP